MDKLTHIGLDVHKETIAVATLRPDGIDCEERTIPNTAEAVRRLLSRQVDPALVRTCYEAGPPTGYDTHRLITQLGIACDVIAPSLIPKRAGVRVKTDRLDAKNLARLHRAGELTPVRVPTPAEEAVRDLIRVREDLKCDRRVARQTLKSFLLRHGRSYPKPRADWSTRFSLWLVTQKFDEAAAQSAFDHLMAACSMRDAQLAAIDREIESAALAPPLAEPVARLRAFRGINTLSAATLVAEVCDFARFGTAASFMAVTGLVPSEYSSGASTRNGSITKTGNANIRRVLVEAAWAYRYRPAVRDGLAERQADQPPEVVAYSWAAQCRLHSTYKKVALRKHPNKAVCAVARELAGFMWGAMTDNMEV